MCAKMVGVQYDRELSHADGYYDAHAGKPRAFGQTAFYRKGYDRGLMEKVNGFETSHERQTAAFHGSPGLSLPTRAVVSVIHT